MRNKMSDLSEEASCASWHFDTEYCLWGLLRDARDNGMRPNKSEWRIGLAKPARRNPHALDHWKLRLAMTGGIHRRKSP
jgi:hypothetical protein